jgi:hypothetical protein
MAVTLRQIIETFKTKKVKAARCMDEPLATPEGQVERLGANEGRGQKLRQTRVGYFA